MKTQIFLIVKLVTKTKISFYFRPSWNHSGTCPHSIRLAFEKGSCWYLEGKCLYDAHPAKMGPGQGWGLVEVLFSPEYSIGLWTPENIPSSQITSLGVSIPYLVVFLLFLFSVLLFESQGLIPAGLGSWSRMMRRAFSSLQQSSEGNRALETACSWQQEC